MRTAAGRPACRVAQFTKAAGASTMDDNRKSAKEVEIDHLLAEEFLCDPDFADRFAAACGLALTGLSVKAALPEPALGGEGFGDLLVHGTAQGQSFALLIEDKITAGPALRQAERYAAHADRLRDAGHAVWSILVAPAAYRGERALYDAALDLETVAGLLRNADPRRLAHRRAILRRALEKKASTGVRLPDAAIYRLKTAYLDHAAAWGARHGISLQLPALRDSYYDGDSWIDPIRHPALPGAMTLRHRLWMSFDSHLGQVDLIINPATEPDRQAFEFHAPEGALLSTYGRQQKGLQLSFPVRQMRPATGFAPDTADAALAAMQRLVRWWSDLRRHPGR